MKKCSKCGQDKPEEDFNKASKNKDGLRCECKECHYKDIKNWRSNNPEKCKANSRKYNKIHADDQIRRKAEWKEKNLERFQESNRRYYKSNRERIVNNNRLWAKKNPERMKILQDKWKQDNVDRLRMLNNKSNQRRYADPIKRLAIRMSNDIYDALTGRKNKKTWQSIVGYNVAELRNNLESKFSPGMSWENYGKWHIDHIKPKSLFKYESSEDVEFKKCWSLDNLQPLWARDNIIKSNHYSVRGGDNENLRPLSIHSS